jgi:exonuclease SbcC
LEAAEAAEQEAGRRSTDSGKRAGALAAKVSEQQHNLDLAVQHLFKTQIAVEELPNFLTAQEENCQKEIVDGQAALALLNGQVERLDKLGSQIAQSEQRVAELSETVEQLRSQLETLAASLQAGGAQLNEIRAGLPCPTLAEMQKLFRQKETALLTLQQQLQTARQESGKADAALSAAETRLAADQEGAAAAEAEYAQGVEDYRAALSEAGFADKDAYQAAKRTPREIGQMRADLGEWKEKVLQLRTAAETLRKELGDGSPADTDQLRQQLQQTTAAIAADREAMQAVYRRKENNRAVLKTLADKTPAFEKSASRHAMLLRLSQTSAGTLSGKKRLSFETYVQAAYFEEVIREANRRLSIMSSGQYKLLRTDEQNGASQTGLALSVLDHYTGKIRSVKTLSGGETFMASLALALGMSDVISCSSGGIKLDTMFIDEGFGSLDSDTLELALRILSELSGGSHLVGIISHVSELAERIDRQIVVKKTPVGSSIHMNVS